MDMNSDEALKNWQLNDGVSEDALHRVTLPLAGVFPSDYMQFLTKHDGGEGFVGENYLILWRAEELNAFNQEYEVGRYAPGLFLFGSNGGGEGYGFDLRDSTMPVIRVPFVGMDLRYARVVASCFSELLGKLSK